MHNNLTRGAEYFDMAHEAGMKTEQGIEMLKTVREICAPLPEVEEIIDGFGHNTFKVRGKSFIMMGEGDGIAGLSFKSNLENQGILIQQGRYARTPYIGQHGWVSTKRGEQLDWEELRQLLVEAYLRAAPKRLVKQVVEGLR